MSSIYAVLTGDIISSSTLSHKGKTVIVERIRNTHSELVEIFQLQEISRISIYRGDGWQSAFSPAYKALRVAVYIRCCLKGLDNLKADSRIGIGVGPVIALSSEKIETGDGAAFTLSGNSLDGLKKEKEIGIQIDSPNEIGKIALNATVVAANHLVRGFTSSQATAVGHALKGWSHQKIADVWKGRTISRQSVTKHLKSAGWDVLEEQIRAFEKIVSMLTRGND